MRWYLLRNRYEICGDIIKISLTGSVITETVVNKRHLKRLLSFDVRWFACWDEREKREFVAANYENNGSMTQIRLHRFITECSDSEFVKHRDGNGLNNLDSNLVTSFRNRTGATRKRNLEIGVGFDVKRIMWYAVIPDGRGYKTIGYFLSEQQAQEWYDNQMSV